MARANDVVGGKYRLIHPLGIGGMGTVFRAEHLALKQQVAIKLLDARGPNAERAVKRFQREAQIAASIRHRNIVYISDFGVAAGAPYLVMELLQGVPLSERLVVGEPLSVLTFLRLMDETLQGLAAVHAAGVVHRDLKPENIFLVREADGSTFPKLLDFGVSRSTERGQGHTITREGVVMGTPEYVSPEQARGRMADHRSDLYSLGVVMYEAIAGRLPYQADNPADLIVALLNAPFLPLSTFRPELGEELSQLVGRAMERDPERRYQNTEEMRAAVAQAIASAAFESHFLPRRFLSPTQRGSAPEAEAAARAELPTLPEGVTQALSEHELPEAVRLFPRRSRRRKLALAAAIALPLALGALLVGGGASRGARAERASDVAAPRAPSSASVRPRPPSEVSIELVGVPDGGEVRLDGVLTPGPLLRLRRDSGVHEIVVSAEGRLPMRVLHDAAADGRYAIALELEKRAGKSAPAKVRARRPGGLVRTPDF